MAAMPRVRILTDDEIARLADCAVEVHGPDIGAELRVMILFAAYTGCRLGECCGLFWDDVHPNCRSGKHEVWIQRTVHGDGFVRLKSGAVRRVSLPEFLLEILQDMPSGRDKAMPFARGESEPWTQKELRMFWHPIRIRFGDPTLSFHALRRFHAARLAGSGGGV